MLTINNVNVIELEADHMKHSLRDCLREAQLFCRKYDLSDVDLNYAGHLFTISPVTNIEKMYNKTKNL